MNAIPTHPPPWARAPDLVVIIALFTLNLLLRNQVQGWQWGDACGVQLVCEHKRAKERKNRKEGLSVPTFPSMGKQHLRVYPHAHTDINTLQGPNPPLSPQPQIPGLLLTRCEYSQASWGLHLAQGIAGQAAVGALIAGTHSLNL